MPEKGERSIGEMFPAEQLKALRVSENVRSMTTSDLYDMAKVYGGSREVENKRVSALTTQDLQSLDSLWGNYYNEVVANYRQGDIRTTLGGTQINPGVLAAGCCCSCTPCCCCSAAVEVDPLR